MVFYVIQKLLTTLYNYLLLFANYVYLLILKMLTEILLMIPFSVMVDIPIIRPLFDGRENAQELTCHKQHPVSIFSVEIAT
jgi:hypothetical protein